MNRYMEQKRYWIEGTHALRLILLETFSDADLAFSPGGQNMSLGALFHDIGEVEYSYIQSLKTFKQDWDYHNTDAEIESSVAKLKAWYQLLDEQMQETVSAFSDEELTKSVERPGGHAMPVEMQLDVYVQALLIFLGKATIYAKAMKKPLSEAMQQYIG